MIPARFRLRKTKDIDLVYRRGKRITAPHFFLFVAPASSPELKVATVVSKKIAKKAVVRNRLRRQVMAVVRDQLASLEHATPRMMLFSAKKDASKLEFEEIRREVSDLLQRVGRESLQGRSSWKPRPPRKS